MKDLIAQSIPFFFILMFVEIGVNILKKKKSYEIKDSFSNLGTGILSLFTGSLSKLFLIMAYSYLLQNSKIILQFWDSDIAHINGLYTWIFSFFLFDFLYYLFHRYSHKVNLLWSAHIVHHSSEKYNLSVALRQSFLQGFFSIPFYLPAALIGIPLEVFITSKSIITIYQFWIHTREIQQMGFLEFFLNTPSHHRVHHSRQAKYMDKNHAGVFIIWDKLFGTFKAEQDEPVYGVYPRFQSLNPILANTSPIKDLFHYYLKAKGIREKFNVLFGSPLFIYEKFKKFEDHFKTNHNHKINSSSIITFMLSLVISLIVIFYGKKLTLYNVLMLISLSSIFLYINGKINDNLEKEK
jgi:alkylglycerol monooxygenase